MFAKNYIMARLALAFILVVGMIGLQPVRPVRALDLVVTNTSDSATGSLRDMVARARFGTNTITFDPSLAGQTITLLSDLKFLMGDITIDGSGLSAQITISGGNVAHIETTGLAKLAISNLILTDGADGAIYAVGESLTLTNVTLKNNHSDGHGGALHISTRSSLIDNCTFSQNQANGDGGAVYIGGSLNNIISDSTFTQNQADYGGAISANGSLIIRNSTIDQNSAVYRGGAIMFGVASYSTIINSTITRNWAENYGGAIFMDGNAESNIFNSTFAGNGATTGSEVDLRGLTNLYAYNTLFACVPGASTCYSHFGNTMLSLTNSIMETGTLADFGLAELADNGGTTQTMAPYRDSPLVDAGDDSICANAQVNNLDQRGVARPVGEHCDIGAFEFNASIIYVKPDATGLNDGTSWENAYTDLQSALAAAVNRDEIWVAAGIYKPATEIDRTISFVLKNGVSVYGGFAGTENVRKQRDHQSNLTTLSGDIGVEDDNSDNSYHVVIGSNTNSATFLDGFTITGGNADNSAPLGYGGGMYSYLGNMTLSNLTFQNNMAVLGGGLFSEGSAPWVTPELFAQPILTNVKFIDNSATSEGGGMENGSNSASMLTNVAFVNNTASRTGGGLLNNGGWLTLMNVTFTGNSASGGGGLSNYPPLHSSSTLTNVTFNNNSASEGGGGMLIGSTGLSETVLINVTFNDNSSALFGGGIANTGYSDLKLKNVTFYDNTAGTNGAGIFNGEVNGVESGGTVGLINTTISNNIANSNGGAIYNESGNVYISNSILNGNGVEEIHGTASVTYSIVKGGHAGVGNLDADPLLGPLQNNGGFTQTLALSIHSPAIDAGDDTYCPVTDQRGMTRPQGSHCDIGAYEATQTAHSILLVQGWNLVSFNVHPTDTSVSSVLSSIAGNYDLVYAWDATGAHAASGNWLKADNIPESPDSLTSLNETMGFWIRVNAADTLDVVGTVPQSTNVSLLDNAGGWNLVAYPSNAAGDLPNVLSDHGVGTDFSMLYAYHPEVPGDVWKLYDTSAPPFINDLTQLAPGFGYWVKVNADHTWVVEYGMP